ncbi:MAG: hypothetical protein IH923_09505 [Nitrospinae bacterium]|nr:hypothetical protein [Nitrospinota bacterium]
MNAFIKFNKGLMNSSLPVKLWVGLLVIFNMIIPLFFLERLEAQVVLAAIMASMLLMTLITSTTGFTRLLGLGHIFWIPLLYFLGTHLDQIPPDDGFGVWVRALMVINATSLVIDAVDVLRYLAGERMEIVKGL